MDTNWTVPEGLPVWVDPQRMSGAPCFAGTRVPVESLFSNLESGLSLDEYLECFPDVTREQAVTVLELAGKDGGTPHPGPLPSEGRGRWSAFLIALATRISGAVDGCVSRKAMA